ncbi:hypothetical protein L7F22_038153 [Adiantum nelumboides]|nr:hypothetical protein [Adiantum nelumboides]
MRRERRGPVVEKKGKWAIKAQQAAGAAENGHFYHASPPPAPPPPPPPSYYRPPPQSQFTEMLEAFIERAIFNCRFITLLAVVGSLGGSILCFIQDMPGESVEIELEAQLEQQSSSEIEQGLLESVQIKDNRRVRRTTALARHASTSYQGCRFVTASFLEYVQTAFRGIDTGHVVILLVEAIDIFLVATVMLIFGMGVYELFVNSIGLQRKDDSSPSTVPNKKYTGSNLFGLFRLERRPLWLEIRSLHELKTKVGHVIVMILLVGMFEKSKVVPISTGFDLLCFSASIFTSSGCLYLLSKLHLK